MESLPKTVPVLAFKIFVCQKFLTSSSSITGGTKPRPRPLRRGSRRDLGAISSATDTDLGRTGSNHSSGPLLVAFSEVVRLLSSDDDVCQTAISTPPVLTIKYALLVSYAQLQGLLPPEERDDDWKDVLSGGGLKQLIDDRFPSDSTYHKVLTVISSFWSTS